MKHESELDSVDADQNESADVLKRKNSALEARLAALEAKIAAMQGQASPGPETQILTGGGAIVAGGVRVGGDFIGRDYIGHITQHVDSSKEKERIENLLATYFHQLSYKLAGLRLGEIDSKLDSSQREPLQLGDVYVPLNTTLKIGADQKLADQLSWFKYMGDKRLTRSLDQSGRPVSALEALAAHKVLVLLGQPGAGKSSFGARILLALAEAWQDHESELAHLGEDWKDGVPFPIHVVLREFADRLSPGSTLARAGDIWDHFECELKRQGISSVPHDFSFLRDIIKKQGALVVFDGLDECGNQDRRVRVRAAVDEFINSNANSNCRFVVTARPYAWPKGPDPSRGVYMIDDFGDDQITCFIRTWYSLLPKRGWCTPADAELKCLELLTVRNRSDLRPLTPKPLLLTLISLLHHNSHKFPADRVDLYEESVQLLLQRWNPASTAEAMTIPAKLSDVRDVLQKVAYEAHALSAGREGSLNIGEGRLLAAFKPLFEGNASNAQHVIEFIEQRAGLLLGKGEDGGERQFSFPHRTFQEYLAACHLAAQVDFTAKCIDLAKKNSEHWTLALALAARIAKVDRGTAAAHALIGCGSVDDSPERRYSLKPLDWRLSCVAALQLMELGLPMLHSQEHTKVILQHVRLWLAAAITTHPSEGGLPAVERTKAGDLLSGLGDHRFNAKRLHLPDDEHMGFVHIQADSEFRFGIRSKDDRRMSGAPEKWLADVVGSIKPISLDEFWIAKYPVTVAQFRSFVNANNTDVKNPELLVGPGTHPIRYVSWKDAIDYANWLREQIISSEMFDGHPIASLVRDKGWHVTLPTESQWERAARGNNVDSLFPWGNEVDFERCNVLQTGVANSSPVGCFPANGFNLYDMIGNVWEWTRTVYDPSLLHAEKMVSDLAQKVATRGGAWSSRHAVSLSTYRDQFSAQDTAADLGFRLVLTRNFVQ